MRGLARNHSGAGTTLGLLAAAAGLILAPACEDSGDPALRPRSVHTRMLPADGPNLPAPRFLNGTPDGGLLALDTTGRVLLLGADGGLVRWWRMPEVEAGKPEGACILADGRVAVADTHYYRVLFFEADGRPAGGFGSQGSDPGQFQYPVKIVQDADGEIYVCEYGGNDRVQKFDAAGRHLISFGAFGTGPGEFQRPSGLLWHQGRIYVADAVNNRISRYSDEGEFLGDLGAPEALPELDLPYDLAVDAGGTLYVAEYRAGRVTRLSLDGRVLGRWGGTGRGENQLLTPWGIAVDASGRIHVADTGNRRIVELTP